MVQPGILYLLEQLNFYPALLALLCPLEVARRCLACLAQRGPLGVLIQAGSRPLSMYLKVRVDCTP